MEKEEKAGARSSAAPDSGRDPRLMLRSVERAFQVLEAIGRAGRPLSLAEVAAEAGIDKSAAQRIAYTLQALDYVERSPAGNGVVPGRRLLDRAFDYLRMDPLIERATPVLIELRKTARERIDLSLFDGPSIIYAIRLQSKRETFFATLIGRRIPAFCASGGRAMMALLRDDEVASVLDRSNLRPLTRRTIIDRAEILAKIEEARRDGFALALEESLIGEIALAAAITDGKGRPVAAVHIAGSLSEWSIDDFRDRFSPLAIEAAHALSV